LRESRWKFLSKSIKTLHERLSRRLTRKEDTAFLREVLEWFEEGGKKMIKDKIKERLERIKKE